MKPRRRSASTARDSGCSRDLWATLNNAISAFAVTVAKTSRMAQQPDKTDKIRIRSENSNQKGKHHVDGRSKHDVNRSLFIQAARENSQQPFSPAGASRRRSWRWSRGDQDAV